MWLTLLPLWAREKILGGSSWDYLLRGVGCENSHCQKAVWLWSWWRKRFPWVWESSESNVVPFSQSLSTLALIEEFLGKREVPCLPGAEGQGVQKWVRNVSYFREFIAALFLEPWQGLLKGFLFYSFFSSPTPFSIKCLGISMISQGTGRYWEWAAVCQAPY